MIFKGLPDSIIKECETKTKLSNLETCITFSLWVNEKNDLNLLCCLMSI